MRWMKDLARGSSAPLARGLRTVYGWHDGDKSHKSAWWTARSDACKVQISTWEATCKTQIHCIASLGTHFLYYIGAVIRRVYTTGTLIPVVCADYFTFYVALRQCAVKPA